jgi:hypothetical protein
LDQQRLKKIKMIVLQIGIFRSKKRKERKKKEVNAQKKTLKCPRDVFSSSFSPFGLSPSYYQFTLQVSSIFFPLLLFFFTTFIYLILSPVGFHSNIFLF